MLLLFDLLLPEHGGFLLFKEASKLNELGLLLGPPGLIQSLFDPIETHIVFIHALSLLSHTHDLLEVHHPHEQVVLLVLAFNRALGVTDLESPQVTDCNSMAVFAQHELSAMQAEVAHYIDVPVTGVTRVESPIHDVRVLLIVSISHRPLPLRPDGVIGRT
jgi:hypothetical protein